VHRGFRSALWGAPLVVVGMLPQPVYSGGLLSKLRRTPAPPAVTQTPPAPFPLPAATPPAPVPSEGSAAAIIRAAQSAISEEPAPVPTPPSSALLPPGPTPADSYSPPVNASEPSVADSLEAGAVPPAEGGLELTQLEQLALANNPTLCQLAAAAQKASGIRQQVGAYPNPIIGYQGMQIGDKGTDQHVAFIQQQIVLGDKLALNQHVLGHDVNAQLWDVESQRYRVLTDVRMRFYEALAAQRRMELTREFQDVAAQGVETANARLEALVAPRSEVLQSEIQLTETKTARSQAEFAFRGAWQELAATVGLPGLASSTLTGELRPAVIERDWDAMYQSLLATSPELCAAHTRVRRAQANIARQEAQPIPNLDVQLGTGYDNGTGSGMFNIQVGAPIPVFNQNCGNIAAAHAEHCRATQEVRRLELSLKSRLARAAQEFDSAAVAVTNYEVEILPRAQETLDLTSQAYTAGEFDFLQVLVARRTFFESNLQYLNALGELAQANARLDGLLLTGGLNETADFVDDGGLRGQSLDGQ
jgi:cobalt-zinc-cadmium efflux system outer membrane protein